jgi:hypothetical protein
MINNVFTEQILANSCGSMFIRRLCYIFISLRIANIFLLLFANPSFLIGKQTIITNSLQEH